MKKIKLSTKLIGSFVIVAIITLMVGFEGWNGAKQLNGDLEEIGQVRLPGIKYLLRVREGAEAIKAVQRTLLNPDLDRQIRDQQYKSITSIREAYRKSWKAYESLPQTQEAAALWPRFVSAWETLVNENNKILDLSRELDKTDILNPMVLHEHLEKFRGDHYKLSTQTLSIANQRPQGLLGLFG